MQNVSVTKPRPSTREMRRAKWAYAFLTPWLLLFAVFYVYPLVYGFVVSLTNFKLGSMSWVGLANYARIFKDYAFWRSLKATFFYCVITLPMTVFLPLFVANALRACSKRCNTFVKILLYLPGVVSTVALVIAWRFIFAPDYGILSNALRALGITNFYVFDSAVTAIPVLSLLVVMCGIGANLIIYSAALDSIPETYYEAAELDGATRSQQFWRITIPMIQPTIVYVLITGTIGILQIYVIPMLMTGGGPNYTTSSLLLLIYNSAFLNGQFGYASAIGVILFLLTGVIAIIQFRITKKEAIEF